MRINRLVLVLFFVCVSVINSIYADDAVQKFTSTSITKNATISLLVKKASNGEVLAEYRSNSATPPASITKVITTATALEMLGPTFRFETYLETDGTLDADGTLNGNLYIRGTGDPTLGSHKIGNQNFMTTWVREVRNAGILRIKGSVIGDISFFNEEAINPQWIWEDIGNYYAPGIFALSYLDNTLGIQLMSGAVGSKAEVVKTIPYIEGLTFENHITCMASNHDGAYVHGLPFSNTRFLVGSVPANKGIFGVKGDIPNPALLLAQHFTQRLSESGISVSKKADYQTVASGQNRTLVYTHKSPQLSEIIAETNYKSNNHYAEHIFRYLGSKAHVPATVQNSIDIVKQFWKSRLINFNSVFLCDGSGLSPQDAISADIFVDLLTYMSQISSYKDEFMASLPVAGENGTLTSFLRDTSLQGKVHAKSGTTSRIKSYAGYIDAPNDEKYIFTVIVNNAAAKPRVVRSEIEKFLLNVCNENK